MTKSVLRFLKGGTKRARRKAEQMANCGTCSKPFKIGDRRHWCHDEKTGNWYAWHGWCDMPQAVKDLSKANPQTPPQMVDGAEGPTYMTPQEVEELMFLKLREEQPGQSEIWCRDHAKALTLAWLEEHSRPIPKACICLHTDLAHVGGIGRCKQVTCQCAGFQKVPDSEIRSSSRG